MNVLQTNHQPPSHLVSNWKYDQFCAFTLLCPKYGNSTPNPQYFQKFSLLSNFIIALSARFQIAINHLPGFFLTQNITNFVILRVIHSGHFLYFHVFRNNILLKHAAHWNFSLQVVNMMTKKNYCRDFFNFL